MDYRSFRLDPPGDHYGYPQPPDHMDLIQAPIAVLAVRHDGAIEWWRGYYRVSGIYVLRADWRLYGSMWCALGWRQPGEPTGPGMVNLTANMRPFRDLPRVDFD